MTDALDQAALEAAPKGYLFELCYSHEHDRWSGPMYSECLPDAADVRNVVPLYAARSAPEAGKAVDDIVAERQRQISSEGWTTEHDDEHDKGEMARAAACYAYEATRTEHQRSLDDGFAPPMWPWAERWWKPTDRRRDLVKAAALIIAEIERLDRAAKG